MNRVYKKRISVFILTLFFMNIFLSQFSFAVKAEGEAVTATKNINKTSALPGEEIDVTLNIKGTPLPNEVKSNDVILIVDKSGSMRGEKIEDAKKSAKSFIDLMDLTKHRVGIVDFSSVIDSMPLTNNATEAKNYIDRIRDGGATYTGSAVRKAKDLLQNCRPEAQPVIVIMTDGAANTGNSETIGFNDAKAAAKEAKDAGIVFYTIALLNSRDNPDISPQNAVLKEMATTAQHHHFVLGSLGLEDIYKGIVKEIGIASAYDVNIKDVVSPEFEIVPGSYDSNIPKPTVSGNEISWHLLELKNQELKFNYKIRAKKDTKLGTYPVSTESRIDYKDFSGSKKTLNIDIPSVTLEYPAPTITEVIPNNGEISGGNEITIKGTNFKPEAKVYFDTALGSNVTVVDENQIKVTVPAATQKTATLKVVNKDGKYATSSYLYWAKPVVTSITPDKGPIAGNTTVTIRGNYFLNGINVKFGNKPAKKVIYKNPTLIYALTDATDVEGAVDVTFTNPDIAKSETIVKDGFTFEGEKVLAPVVNSITPSEGYIDEAKTVKINGENFKEGAKVKFGDKEATNVKVESNTTITATVPIVDAPKVVDVKVINADLQEGKLENAYKYIEKVIPAPTIDSIKPNWCYINETQKITINGKDFQKGAKVYIGATEATAVDSTYSNYIYATVPANSKPEVVDVKVVNPDGKEAVLEGAFTYKDTLAPEIKYITPNEGIYNEEKNIYIYANNFKPGVRVKIGDKEALQVTPYSTYIYAKVPAVEAPKTVDVTIINPDGKEAKLVGGYTYKPMPEKPAPTITTVNPNWCYINESKTIAINGSNFQLGAKVYIGGVEATEVDSTRSTNYMYAKVPASNTPTTVDVKVVNPDGKEVVLKDGFTYKDIPGPEITEIDLKEAYINESKYVNIRGNNFQKGAVVKFGDKEVPELNYYGQALLLVKCPVETTPKTVDITVINPDGKKVEIKDIFTYKSEPEKPAPTISNVKENWSYIGQTKRVSVNGTNFQKGAKVYIDGVEATEVDSSYSNYVYATVPVKDTPSTVDVKVVNPDGKEVVLEGGFTYKDTPGPEITGISPNEGIYNQEKKISIYARNFKPGVKVKIGDKDALETSLSSTYIYVTVPVADAPKSVDVTIINPDGKEAKVVNGYTYKPIPEKPAPTIKEITPNSGLINTAKSVAVYGQNFQNGITAKFGDVEAKVQYMSSTYISVSVPQKSTAGAVDVTLTNPDGKQVVLAGGYSYTVPEMKVNSLSPTHGKLEGGYCVGIYGTNFASDSEIYVDGKKVDNIEYRNSTLIYITKMPARSTDGQVDVEVRSASLGQSKTIKFTYDPKPVVPAPQIKSYSSYFIFGDAKLDIYAYNLSKNMVLKNVTTGEEITNTSTSATYVSFKMPLSYRGQKVMFILVNKDANKESAPYEFQIK